MAILYFIAQLVGALLGYRLLEALTPAKVFEDSKGSCGACSVVPHEDMNEFTVFVIEFIATSVLVGICLSLWDKRNEKKQDGAPLKIGLTIFMLCVMFVSTSATLILGYIIIDIYCGILLYFQDPYSGGSMNPIRTFAPAFWNQSYPMHWVSFNSYF